MIKGIKSLMKTFCLKLKFKNDITIKPTRGLCYKSEISVLNGEGKRGKIVLGKNFHVRDYTRIVAWGGEINIGDYTSINAHSACISLNKITIGNNCSIGPGVYIYDHDHAFNENGKIPGEFKSSEIKIGNNVWIAAGVIILRGSVIGNNVVIGAGCIVQGNIPDNMLVTSKRENNMIKLEKRN
ncbi:acyltransferase [Acetivibrio cellulolyticus]|uniref:acyltransferase n=1 Tax=Acetivibrio cellulolyticus TaxID=35830 RepID=UPI0001E2CBDD|nr:acyltransferase [Acetivibrio cellulolyticus]